MTITNNYSAEYFLQNDAGGYQKPVSSIELSEIFYPSSLGYVMSEELGSGSIISQLGLQGREFVVSTDQVMWREEGDMLVAKDNKATFNTVDLKTFTVNPSAFPTVVGNIDSNVPTDAQWVGISVGLRFVAWDSTGEQNHGVITAVASDEKSFEAQATGAAAFTLGADVAVMFTNYNLDDCECPPAIAIKNWAPTLENTLVKDGVAVEYCEEVMIKEAVKFDIIPTGKGNVTVDTRLTDALKVLNARNEATFAFDKRLTASEAASLGVEHRGTDGLFTTLEGRASKIEGLVTTLDDVNLIVALLKGNQIKEATMHCSAEQFNKLQALFPPSSAYTMDPFSDKSNQLIYFGFQGFKINGVTIRFKEWSALDLGTTYGAKRYNFVVVPEGKLSRLINGKRESVGYLNVAYFGGNGKTWKRLRSEDPGNGGYCGVDKISYLDKFAPIVFMAHKFIVGIPEAEEVPEG